LWCCSNQNQVTGYSGRPGNDIVGLDIPCNGKTFCQVRHRISNRPTALTIVTVEADEG
jgi:hypothetical protein